jgi:hypothetical protein
MPSTVESSSLIFRPSAPAKFVMILICGLGLVACTVFFGLPALRAALAGIPLDASAWNAMLIGLIGVVFFAWMIWILIRTFSIRIIDTGISGIVFRITPSEASYGRFFKRRLIYWKDVTEVISRGHEVIIAAGSIKLIVNVIAFSDPKQLSAYIDDKTSHIRTSANTSSVVK